MNANTTLEQVRSLAKTKLLELPPLAGEEMTLPQTDPHRDGFVAGERAFAAKIVALLESADETGREEVDPTEEEMVLSLGKT